MRQEYVVRVRKEPSYLAVEKNVSGSRPKELFEDCIEEVEKQFGKDRSTLKDAVKDGNIEVGPTTTYEEFEAALQAADVELDKIMTPHRCRASLSRCTACLGHGWQ